MKKLLLLAFFVPLFAGCSDNDDTERKAAGTDPSITETKFYCAYSGSNSSVAVDVTVDIPDPSSIKRVSLFTKAGNEVFYKDSPTSGKYTLYNHLSDCSGNVPKGQYYFVFTLTDNSKIISEAYPK